MGNTNTQLNLNAAEVANCLLLIFFLAQFNQYSIGSFRM